MLDVGVSTHWLWVVLSSLSVNELVVLAAFSATDLFDGAEVTVGELFVRPTPL